MSAIDPNRLYTALLNTGLQSKNNPLYQVIYNLIKTIEEINTQTNTFISGGSSSIINQTLLIQQLLLDSGSGAGEDGLSIPGLRGVPGPVVGIPIELGGSRQVSALLSASLQNIIEWKDKPIYWQLLDSGLFVRAQVEVRANGTTTVTPSIYNVTDAVTEITGAACSATNIDYSGANQKQTLAISTQTVKKVYRMRVQASDAVKGVFGNGYLEIVPVGTV